MKIALLLSGQLRSFATGWSYINKNLLTHHGVDVYFHTWSKNWNPQVISLYKPKDFIVEFDGLFGEYSGYRIASPMHPARNFFMMYRSIMLADLIRQSSGVEYDWIVRTRFDFALNKKIEFDELDKSKMYFCDTQRNADHTAVHDQFVVSNPKDMSIYSSVYRKIDLYHDSGCILNGEDLLIRHLKEHGMLTPSKISYMDLNPPFLHGKYNYGKHSLIRDDMENWI
jgi:hypothetical protein